MAQASVWIGETEYYGAKAYHIYFKQKLNQVGRFEYTCHHDALSETDKATIIPGKIVRISVYGTVRFEGYISNVTKDKAKHTWLVEGQSLAGILSTRNTRTPVTLRAGVDNSLVTATQVVQQAIFRLGGFTSTGTTGWKVVTDGDGFKSWLYKYEAQPVLDHVINAAKVSGYDWRVYLDDGSG
jgi:hypothetical protein